MKILTNKTKPIFAIIMILISILACSIFTENREGLSNSIDPTPTPTAPAALPAGLEPNPCDGLSGVLEMQILVGPSEVAGLEPVAVGELPFSVMKGDDSYIVQGGGDVTYQDVLQEEWGTYTVFLDMIAIIDGQCILVGEEVSLEMGVEATGEQLLEVRAEGFQGDYPWSGSHHLDLFFPWEEGAQAEGEGWAFILHLNE